MTTLEAGLSVPVGGPFERGSKTKTRISLIERPKLCGWPIPCIGDACQNSVMTRWEYRFIDLFRGTRESFDQALTEFAADVRQAGVEGWEAIGEIEVSYHQKGTIDSAQPSARVLVLKRPA
ncbi:hypothetical protein ACFFX1_28320 [Dactylosporangium sucinum]|uniref:hypothetical protein n=1 Tax=Dactylosporangium sucinum TaxID=1424081 RepID=UPI00167E53F3|nr:hypothetical protein [Dactylosporangium sucinum]